MQTLVPRGEVEQGPQDPELRSMLESFKKLQEENRKLSADKSSLAAKVNENALVQQEMDGLDEDARVFKLVGPVLVHQDVDEARTNVKSRMDLLQRQVEGLDDKLAEVEKKMEDVKTKVVNRQKELRAAQQKASGSGAAAEGE